MPRKSFTVARKQQSTTRGRTDKSLRKELRGRELRLAPQPPEFTSRPWFSLIVRSENLGTTFTMAQLGADLRTQLGFPADLPIYFRLRNIRIWGPLVSFGAGPLTPLNVGFRDFIAENSAVSGVITLQNRVLEQYTRYPDQVNRACIGYEYPIAHQNLSLFNAGGLDLILASLTGAGAGSVAYTQLLWRTGVLAPSADAEVLPVTSAASRTWF